MIQRFSVRFQNSENLPAVLDGLADLGFPDSAIRSWREQNTDFVNVHAYRDSDVDTMRRLDPALMEEHCVRIWSRIGNAEIKLTVFSRAEPIIEGDVPLVVKTESRSHI
jgi:hypothetical protein